VLALGSKLVDELGLDDSVDTLSRWMAHYVADLLTRATTVGAEEKSHAERECFDAVLALWRHRSELPTGKRPYEELEPVIRAVESLDPERSTPRYFRMARPPRGEKVTAEQQGWLNLVESLDYSAKVIIGYCLAQAASLELDKSKDWSKHAEAMGDVGAPEVVIRLITRTGEATERDDPDADTRSVLSDRAKRLRAFMDVAEAIATTLEERLGAMPALEEHTRGEEELHFLTPPPPPQIVDGSGEKGG
jgi:hypothetical protein